MNVATKSKTKKRAAAKKSAPKKAKPKDNECGCGCGAKVARRFAQGHDSKAKSLVRQFVQGEIKKSALPSILAKQLPELRKAWGY